MKMRSIGIAIVLIVLIVGGVLIYKRDAARSLGDTLRSVKETSQDAATTSKVKTALLLSKHVSAFDVKASTNRGEVTLTGEVPAEETRRLAGAITQDTSGVTAVHNNLTVNPAARGNQEMEQLGDRVADLEIKTLVLDQLGRSPELKDKQIKVQVSKRIVTLDGAVDTPAQKRAVEQMALQAPGVQGLAGQLTVANAAAVPESADEKLARRVEFELYSTRALPLQSVQIRSQDGTVILSGPVTSRAEKLLAERVTQSVDGVKRVINNLSAPEGTIAR
ncbi:MAG TPA: BON domain-containing protein [Candidatus Acidoferrum sp.]|jgi:hyperosmotically inducible protein|nr:BON domain-containing protein [Methylomirabilota bacterium]HYR73229.1 BON domain-containing protein [Candidatus Acidoferrum sp.]